MTKEKCPRCDLNYLNEGEAECAVCSGARAGTQSPLNPTTDAKINECVLLIRINRTFKDHISRQDLYNVTRGVWKVGPRRENVDYAFSVFQGEVLEVYKIFYWEPATKYSSFIDDWALEDRWQFVGEVDESLSKKYKGKSVKNYFKKGNMSPTIYVNA